MRTHKVLWGDRDLILAANLVAAIRDRLDELTLSDHANERARYWGVNRGQVHKAVSRGELVEVHNEAKDGALRFLFRWTPHNAKRSICVVVDINLVVVTVYCNGAQDQHNTLRLSQYDCTLVQLCANLSPTGGVYP